MTHHVIFFRLRLASQFSLVPLFILLSWPFYNFKSFIPNGSASPFGRRSISRFNQVIYQDSSRGFCPCRSPRQKLSLLNPMEDEFAKDPGPVGGLHSGSTSSVPSRNSTSGPKLVLALIPAPFPPPALSSSNELFKQFIRAYLESNQGPRQPPAEREQSFKAKVLEVYYGKLHMDCSHFCQ